MKIRTYVSYVRVVSSRWYPLKFTLKVYVRTYSRRSYINISFKHIGIPNYVDFLIIYKYNKC